MSFIHRARGAKNGAAESFLLKWRARICWIEREHTGPTSNSTTHALHYFTYVRSDSVCGHTGLPAFLLAHMRALFMFLFPDVNFEFGDLTQGNAPLIWLQTPTHFDGKTRIVDENSFIP